MDIRSVYLTPTVAGVNNLVHQIGNEKFLIGASLEETDNTLNCPANDGANIWIQDPTVNNAISLSNGYMEGGCLAGFGCIPLRQGHEIVATIYHSTAGNTMRLNLMFADNPASVFGWTTKPLAKPIKRYGQLRVIEVIGAADDLTIELKPPTGLEWEIVDALGTHNDTSSRSMTWAYTDGVTTAAKITQAGMTASLAIPIAYSTYGNYASSSLTSALTLSSTVWATLTANGLTAGKALHISALVREYAE